ncbi:class I SAM-dependent rRNA methyltransferase [Aerococcaceae bacterium DSM 111022]|nr:class I SAM-dependent rRNA methyltransferase [Aerococcaceae bacterium DSM 111022]
MANIVIYNDIAEKIQSGARLIRVADIVDEDQVANISEGAIVQIRDQQNMFVAKAIVVKQNKGFAWVFTLETFEYFDEAFIQNVIEVAIQKRMELFEDEETNSFRLFNGEGDGIGGLTIDWYNGFIQINWYSFALFNERDTIVETLKKVIPQLAGIYETKRYQVPEDDWKIKHTEGAAAPQPLVIKENNVYYAVYLGEDWMTGIFLDQRHVREFIKTQAADLSVLNLFSYTGAFSVAAAVGGAAKTVSVDVANRSLDWTKENFELNNISTDPEDHEIRVMDVFDYVAYAKRHELQFDMLVCDPPSFARTKKYQFSAEKNYKDLAVDLFDITAPGGMTILSTNHSGYDLNDFRDDMISASKEISDEIYLIQQFELPSEDFKTTIDTESNYLKVLVFYRG